MIKIVFFVGDSEFKSWPYLSLKMKLTATFLAITYRVITELIEWIFNKRKCSLK